MEIFDLDRANIARGMGYRLRIVVEDLVSAGTFRSKAAVGAALEIHRSDLEKYLNGERGLNLERMVMVASWGYDLNWLITGHSPNGGRFLDAERGANELSRELYGRFVHFCDHLIHYVDTMRKDLHWSMNRQGVTPLDPASDIDANPPTGTGHEAANQQEEPTQQRES